MGGKSTQSRNVSADLSQSYQLGGSGAFASTDSQKQRQQLKRTSSTGSAYRDTSGSREPAKPTSDERCEISTEELRDLQKTININKDIIRSLVEAQQAVSPTHKALKQSL